MAERAHPLALVDLLAALLAGALWYVRPDLGPLPLFLIAFGLVVRHLVEPRPALELTALDAAVCLFLISASVGLLIAYDRDVALAKFWVILGGVAIYGALVRAPVVIEFGGRVWHPLSLLLAALPAGIAVYYVATADFSLVIGKIPLLDGLFRWISSWQPHLPGHKLHPNVAGGLIAALMPLQTILLAEHRVSEQHDGAVSPDVAAQGGQATERASQAMAVAALGVSAAGLLLSASRGAWVALVAVAAGSAAWILLSRRMPDRRGAVVLAGLTCVIVFVLATFFGSALPALLGQDGSAAAGRASLAAGAAALARDYAFTGLGLGGFQMAYSSYILMLHVGHTFHSHNLLLDIWLEQGLLGLLSFVWLLCAAGVAWWRVQRLGEWRTQLWANAALAAVAVLVLHGLVDDAFYGSRGVLLALAPFALLAKAQADAVWAAAEPPTLTEMLGSRSGLAAALVLAVALLVGLLPSVRSQFQANLGALAQTRAELSVYSWPAWPIQDALRRSPDVDLAPAIAHFEKALALDANNATASRRLGQVLLSRGDYGVSGLRLSSAYCYDYTNPAARQLYGEWLAINDRPQEATALLRTVDLSQGQLQLRGWWYSHIEEPERAAAISRTAGQRQ